ncbi:pentapeptide repeat-containing protein [Streptomyces sp. NPDC048523]|uniref:pentapeptide repeat-containing protein n=1 Tax=Streptomyces sp. NPDC048523 TaxID=3365567 RepID=UPI003722006C
MSRRTIWIAVLTACGVLGVVVCGVILVPRLLYPPLSSADLSGVGSAQARIELQQAQSRLANDARSAMLQSCVGLLVVIGAAATWRQVQVSRESQITERFTRAVDQIGNQDVNVRIGGIYALERIAKNSHADRDPIQFLLGAFVRGRLTWLVGTADGPEHPTASVDEQLPVMNVRAPDVQAAMWVLERRSRTPDDPQLYLSRVDLRRISLRDARLSRTLFRHSNLARAALAGARLDRSDFTDADLRRALLDGASLKGANLNRAHLQGASLRQADLRGANLRGADLNDTVLNETLMTGAQADETTVWPTGLSAEARRELGIVDEGPSA